MESNTLITDKESIPKKYYCMKSLLASHNTLTYLPVKSWWMYPFTWFAKCQEKDLATQYDLGVRLFDFRVLVHKNSLVIAHGLMKYKGDISEMLDYLASKNDSDIVVQIVNEDTFYDSDPDLWLCLVEELVQKYPSLKFTLVDSKKTWTIIRDEFPKNRKSRTCFWKFCSTSPIPLPILHKVCYSDDIEDYKESTDKIYWFDFIDERFDI